MTNFTHLHSRSRQSSSRYLGQSAGRRQKSANGAEATGLAALGQSTKPPFLVAIYLGLASLTSSFALLGCEGNDAEQAATPKKPVATTLKTGPSANPKLKVGATPKEEAPRAQEPVAEAEPDPAEHKGPWLVVTRSTAGVYAKPEFDRENKLGYVRNGGRVPVKAKPVSTTKCSGGWYAIIGGGYICGNLGTTDLESRQVKFAMKPPNLDQVLPYKYARNAKNGTPLYKSVPSREQMRHYEPYLNPKKKAESEDSDSETASNESERTRRSDDSASTSKDTEKQKETRLRPASISSDAGLGEDSVPTAGDLSDAGIEEEEVPWWQQDNAKERLHELSLDELAAEADDVLAKRMVAGFYVAVDKTFRWNDRTWYKTTKGLVAPTDRFWETKASEFKGVELDGKSHRLPIGWVYGWRKSIPVYSIDLDKATVKKTGELEHFAMLDLTGEYVVVRDRKYYGTKAGGYVRDAHIRITKPVSYPENLGENERWIDVNLEEQTLVAFIGKRPVYATLVSSGKSSKVKSKDHSTPIGEWRVREKHLTTTMDGDGSAAGDLPYSIEDVPYVMYYHRSYALHGAFWHRNYGSKMSHGCINLSPLDAKYLFFFAGPHMPEGFHGAWATADNPGSRVRVHE